MAALDAIQISAAGALEERGPRRTVACTHCALPVPEGLRVPGDTEQFCCAGCRAAYALLHEAGLQAFYSMRDSLDRRERTSAKRATGARYHEFDDPSFQQRHVHAMGDDVRAVDLAIEGLHCGACVWLLERLPRVVPGVAGARVDYQRKRIHIQWRPSVTPLSSIARRLDTLGYPVRRYAPGSRAEARIAENRRYLIRVAIAGACAGNVMLISFALYGGMFSGMAPAHEALFRWTSLLFGAIAVLGPGAIFLRGALTGLRAGVLNMDLPIAIGLGSGFAMGLVNTAGARGDVYFDTVTMLVFLLLLGRWLQFRQQSRSSDALALLGTVTPGAARRIDASGAEEEIAVESVVPGNTVAISVGECVPVDGTVLEGAGHLDTSLITGESRPVTVGPGDGVVAGSVNLTSPLRVSVTASGADTRIGGIMRMVEDAALQRPPIVRAADRMAQVFVAGVLGLALLTLGLWLAIDATRAIENATALLIVTCPCALALATPLAIASAIGQGARRGVLIKSGEALESLSRPGVLLLDKTGTVTEGAMRVVEWHGPGSLRGPVAALERSFTHPIAKALSGFGDGCSARVESARAVGSRGVQGVVNGDLLLVGSPELIEPLGLWSDDHTARTISDLVGNALTPVIVSVNGRVRAIAGCGDPIRSEAGDATRSLRAAGWSVGLLSGDHPGIVASVGRSLGLAPELVRGGADPESKATMTRELVGDAENDAAALASASVGIAVEGGAEASLSAADIYLTNPGLEPLVETIDGARRTMRVIRRNFAVSLGYNVVCASLAIAGLIHPLIAAVIMPISSLTVVTMSYRSRIFPERMS